MAVSEPKSPARGNSRRTHPEPTEQANLNKPLINMEQIPMCHVWMAASCSAMPAALAAKNAGPRTKKTMPNVLGVSSPKGMAVTSPRPVFFASCRASQKNSKSPTMTPTAVPGIM